MSGCFRRELMQNSEVRTHSGNLLLRWMILLFSLEKYSMNKWSVIH